VATCVNENRARQRQVHEADMYEIVGILVGEVRVA
jgi:hypothetical protein